ncbi:MAG: DEAD/DEAH box helicase [Rhizobacter sp.]|nr:DEAD/DEAH box helicase [Rhizobacter sp.]
MTSFLLPEDFDLGEHFDHRTLTRAMELKPQQAVLSLQVEGPRLVSRVQGAGPTAYQQNIQWVVDRRLGPRLEGRCSCPVGHNCKHVAAALMAFEAQQIRIKKGLPETPGVAAPVARPVPPPPPAMLELGTLALVPVLRLTTCVDVASEALLHHRYGSAQSRSTSLRQGAAQLVYRYQPPSGRALEYHFPAGNATTTLAEVTDPMRPGHMAMGHFQRQAQAEAAALRTLVGELEMRPWSLAAGMAVERATRHTAARPASAVQTVVEPHGQMTLVPQRRDHWPELLSRHIPELEERGWQVEVADDFPYELHQADEWSVDIGEEPGGNWFSVGLQVSVEGQPVNLVPLLVGLVQTGWLHNLDAALARGGEGDVLVPWATEATPAPGTAPRQRLLRLPVARVLPLMEWLRTVFRVGEKTSALRLSRFDLGTLETLAATGAVKAPPSFTELIEQVRQLDSAQGLPAVAASPRVRAQLRHYQLDGLAWMDFLRRARLGGILADDMGLGKTLQALALLQGELDAGRLDKPSLVVVPTSLIGNWEAEARRFTPDLKLVVLHGAQRARHFKHIAGAQLVVTSYPLAMRDIATLGAQEWHYVLLDEAQRIKNSRSQAALSVKGLNARHRLCLSGTPLENHLGELWSLMDFVCPGLLGSEPQFREHYRTPIERRQDGYRAQQLARRVKPFLLRRTKQQVARELPEKTETLLRVDLTGTQRDLYETVRATMDSKLREVIAQQGLARSQIMVLDALLRLRQVCCDPRLLKIGEGDAAARPHHPSAKMELLLDLLPTLVEDGRRVLLFSQFTEMLSLIELELARLKLPYLLLTGESRDRASLVERFQQGEVPLFLISLKAGGVGLNLTAADTVILYDPWWNPAVEQQAIDRAYRIGQDKPVFVYKLLASGTVEDKMLELQARKSGLADALLSGVAGDAALTPQDFDELFKPLGGE